MDLNNLQSWHYVIIGGAVVLLLGLVLYFLPARKAKVPGGILAAAGGLAAGVAIGIVWMGIYGYKLSPPEPTDSGDGPPAAGEPPPMAKMGGMPKMGGGMPKGGGGGRGGPPSPRVQLVSLVNALDRLVDKPVTLNLTPDDRAALADQLRGLDTTNEIKDDDAKARLDAILKVVEKDRSALEAVGYRWPAPEGKGPPKGGFGGPPKDSPNPFKEEATGARLKSVRERLEKK